MQCSIIVAASNDLANSMRLHGYGVLTRVAIEACASMFDVMWRERQGARSTLRQDFDGSYQGLASASIPRCGGSSISSVTARPLKPAHRTISRRSSSITCICTATTTSTRTPRRRCSPYSASGDAKLRTKTLVLVGLTTAMMFIGFPPPNSGRSEDSNDEPRFASTRSRRRGRPQAARGGEELMKLAVGRATRRSCVTRISPPITCVTRRAGLTTHFRHT